MALMDTPRTDAGNSTFMPNGLEDFSVENTFMSPSKRNDDLVSHLRNGRGVSLKTPRSRVPFADRRNLPVAPAHGEFTPLLKSVAKKNFQKTVKVNGMPETPAFLRPGYKHTDSPVLPAGTPAAYGEDTASSAEGTEDGTPVPQIASSSAQSTPLAILPKRDAGGILADQGNALTLREQESASLVLSLKALTTNLPEQIINKIEKENFGLKLKIHFLEEALKKSGSGLNETALKENTDLKVDKVTMQKELARAKKTLDKAEREVEAYRAQLENAHETMKRKHTDQKLLEELEFLKREVASKDGEIQELREELENATSNGEVVEKLQGDIEDLEADVREKDRLLDERDEEVDQLKAQAKHDSDNLAELYDKISGSKEEIKKLQERQNDSTKQAAKLSEASQELEEARRNIHDLEEDLDRAEAEIREAKQVAQEAEKTKQNAEDDLEELRDEMSNKSINSKGLSRQLEEKAQKLQSELNELRSRSSQSELDGNSREQRLQKEIIRLQQQHEGSDENLRNLNTRIQQIAQELVHKTEEKDLLHTRHEALTAESHSLQKDLSRSQAQLRELERSLEAEREHALNNDRQLREEARRDTDRSNIEIGNLQRRLDDQSSQLAADKDHWASQRRSLESQLEKANERAAGLQRTIEKLQESEGTLSGREHKLQEALESEKERHQNEEAVLTREMQELDRDINQKRTMIENVRAELSRGKEELRTSKRDVASLEEKVQALEDEVDVLQGGLDEESERARGEISQARQEAEITRRDLHAAKQELIRAEAAHADAKAEIERFQGNLQAGLGSNEQVSSRLREIESQLQQVRKDKQSLQDKLAGVNIELHSLRSSVAETEAERDELRDQLKQTGQIDKIFEADQEKLDLQKAKLRLESDLSRLREECENCIERNVALEHKLQEEIQRAAVEEGHLHDELANSQRKLSAASSGRDRELNTTKQRCQRLEARIGELESRLLQADEDSSANHELSALQRDLSATRRKETEYLQRESSHREAVRDLKQRITSLERQAHEAEVSKLAVDSPKSSVGGSARKAEVVELRHQLTNAQQQLRDYRVKSRDAEKDLHRQLSDVERRAQANVEALEQQREELEQDLLSTRHNQESQQIKLDTTEKTISRLRSRIQTLESSLLSARQDNTGNRTMADERKDLHEMLKDAKLEAEDLQLQISAGQARLKSATTREQEVRTTLHRVRTERNQQQKESSALSKELGNLQSRYERAVSRFAREQKKWEDERRSIVSRVRFPNMSISEVKDNGSDEQLQALQTEMQAKERQHAGEIRGLSYQIRWLRSKWERELGFRRGLALQKRYLNLRIEMFEACNKLDMERIFQGGHVKPEDLPPAPVRKPKIKVAALIVIAIRRMQGKAEGWKEKRAIKEMLMAKMQAEGVTAGMTGEERQRKLMKRISDAVELAKGG